MSQHFFLILKLFCFYSYYVSKAQSKYLSELKENIDGDTVIFLGDFSENYSFVVQDEVQSFHWNNMMCSIHTVVIYYKDGNSLSHLSYAIISEDNTHDVHFVYKVIELVILDLKVKLPNLSFIHMFTDGCAGQYKNRKTMFNLCQLEHEFHIKGEWNFFATSHGKSPCDGIGGTIKRLTTAESLKRPIKNQILTAKDMYLFCSETIPNIISKFLSKEEMKNARTKHAKRYDNILRPIPGTRSYHQFIPLSGNKIGAKRCSNDSDFACVHVFDKIYIQEENINISSYAAAVYDDNWWIGLIIEKNEDEYDVTMKFMHPKGPSNCFFLAKT